MNYKFLEAIKLGDPYQVINLYLIKFIGGCDA